MQLAKLKENSTILKHTGEEIIATEESVDRKLLSKADKDYVDAQLATKVDKVPGKQLSTEDFTTAEKTKLANIEEGANKYTHPATHPASMITETSSRRFVSDDEKNTWNTVVDKADKSYVDAELSKKAEKTDIPTKVSQLENDKNYVTQEELGDAGYGDMLKSIYDTNNNGKVDKAEMADNVPWTGITNKPSTFPPSSHNHSISNVTGLQNALDNKMGKGPLTWNDLKGV